MGRGKTVMLLLLCTCIGTIAQLKYQFNSLEIHIIWYGKFSPVQRSILADFIQSLETHQNPHPLVSTWWNTTRLYADVALTRLGRQILDEGYSLGVVLKRADVATLVATAVKSGALPMPENHTGGSALYVVLTSGNVAVERFCMSSCGFHATVAHENQLLRYAWVGNAESQCPGQCAWPFHQPLYGPRTPPLVSPNADVGIDGMIINIATVLAGTVTRPLSGEYFEGGGGGGGGVGSAPPLRETMSACAGIFGKGAYPGFPGQLRVDSSTGGSYNAHGMNGRKFLLPATWDPSSRSCQVLV